MRYRGTKSQPRQQIADELDKLGAQLHFSSDVGILAVSLKVKKPNLPAAVRLMGEILREPTFPESEFEILKRETREQLNQSRTEPTALAFHEIERRLNPVDKDDVRYIPSIDEQIARLDALKLDDVRKVYETQVGARAGELAAVG